jgi:tetratricopeptide (TPR) repeat protein/transcriptional regulator with XRE-family HTH domain
MPDEGFATDLEFLRLNTGLSLRELVRLTGIPRSTLSDALAGRRAPRLETVLAIVRACRADPDPWRRRWAQMSRQRSRESAEVPGAAALPTPAQLPRDIAGFASRERELGRLEHAGIAVIHGRPGAGKTALAVHWAHSVAARYPDGQLFLNLRGHHATLGPVTPVEALGRMLGSLGVPFAPLTQEPDEAAGLWRSTLAGRRLLILLDDAISADQIQPLLPGASGCTLIVTSRHHLADLVVHDGAESILVDVLPAGSSTLLLGHVAGSDRVAGEPDAAAEVATACGHLPLALRLAGALVGGTANRSFAELARELSAGDRLSALEGLSRPSPVEKAFELSYLALPPDAGLLFRSLGLHVGTSISVQVAALLSGLDPDVARGQLRTLAEAHLVEPDRSGRYRIHDLLLAYAARLVESSESVPERDAARERLLEWYVDSALAVSALLDQGRDRAWVDEEARSTWKPTDDEASAWLDAEHRNVTAAIEFDAQHGTGRHAWALVDLMTGLLFRRKEVAGLITATDAGLVAARGCGDRHAEGVMLLRRGWLRWRSGQRDAASADFYLAQGLFHETGVQRAEASALRGLSNSLAYAGQVSEARECAEAALAIYRATGDSNGQAATLSNLAFVTHRAADFAASAEYLEASLALHRMAGSRSHIAMALGNLAHVLLVRGAVLRAVSCNEEAIGVAQEIGDGVAEIIALANSGLALEQAGQLEDAYRRAEAAVARAQEMNYRFGEAAAMDVLATMSRRLGRADAQARRAQALNLARRVNDLAMEAEILLGAARDAYQDAVRDVDTAVAGGGAEGGSGTGGAAAAGGRFHAARDAAQRALDAALAGESPQTEAEAIGLLAACDLGVGDVAGALDGAQRALEMHTASGARLAEIAARCILAHAHQQNASPDAADTEWRAARSLVDQLALPAAAPVRRSVDGHGKSSLPELV